MEIEPKVRKSIFPRKKLIEPKKIELNPIKIDKLREPRKSIIIIKPK